MHWLCEGANASLFVILDKKSEEWEKEFIYNFCMI